MGTSKNSKRISRMRRRIITGFFALTIAGFSLANTTGVPSTASGLGEQRYHYNMAKSALADKDMASYRHYYALLGNYPLVPYLDYNLLRDKMSDLPYEGVDAFFAEYPHSFLAIRLRQIWLTQLAIEEKWQSYLDYYQPEVAGTELQCHYLYARLQTGDSRALNEVAPVWNVGKSQPEQCDPLFNQWYDAGHLTQELAWSRFTKAIKQRNQGLGRYLAAKLTGKHRQMAERYMRVDRHPELLKQHDKFRQQSALMQAVIAHGIQRLARRDAKQARKHWELYAAQQLFSEQLSRKTKMTLVRYLTRQGYQVQAERMLRHSIILRQTEVVAELIREALKDLDWQAVNRRIQMLPNEEQASKRWRYWRARAVAELDIDSPELPQPKKIYAELAQDRSFYGFLAADILGRDYALEDVPAEVRPKAIQAIADLPGMRRAKELWLTGNLAEARAEWWFTTDAMTRKELVSAGQLARRWGWYNKGIQAMIAGDLWNHLTIRFPLAYQETVTRIASDMKLAPTLIYAIARQESAFAAKAHSAAGARGLMQLMPATARQTARRQGLEYSLQALYNPEHNIMLGSSYFHALLERFNNNRILAMAAYNAGPHRVSGWMSEPNQKRPFDVWIETIPYHETRGYVQNVLSFSVIYGYRMGLATPLVTAQEAKDLL